MLRFDHMPSDFNEMFLFLGSREDLLALESLLSGFAAEPRSVDLRATLPPSQGTAQVVLAVGEGEHAAYGMREAGGDRFDWVLNAWQAEQIALRLHPLTEPALASGNDIVELGLPGEIPIKFSRGEFTDEFLTPEHHLHPDYRPAGDGE